MIDTSEIITSKNHIEPLAEDGYIIYKLGYISPVADGRREARMIWSNERRPNSGASAFVYVAYASDTSGTGFTMTFNAALDYIAIKSTTTAIASPVVTDFTGLWKKYKGDAGSGTSAPTTVSSSSTNGDNGTNHTHALDNLFGTNQSATFASITCDTKGRIIAIADMASFVGYMSKIRQTISTPASQFKTQSVQYAVGQHRMVRFTWIANNGTEKDFGQMIQMKMPDNSYETIVVIANTKSWVTQSFTRDASYIWGQLDFSPNFTGAISIILETI